MKDNGGYVMLDCGGLDLIKGSTPQTITGLFERTKKALATGKQVIATNCVWDDFDVTPISVLVIQFSTALISATACTLRIDITNEDVVTITNYAE